MVVDKKTTLLRIKQELANCQDLITENNWEVSELDEENEEFQIKMISPIDQEIFILSIQFDDYNQKPLFLDFIDPDTGEKGTKHAYPKNKGKGANFFHGKPCICNPCSRKAYKELGGPHADWNMGNWKSEKQTMTLTNLKAILTVIWLRISTERFYAGRMA